MERRRNMVIAAASVIVVAGGAWWTWGSSVRDTNAHEGHDADSEQPGSSGDGSSDDSRQAGDGAAPADPRVHANDPAVRAIADELRRRIRTAREARESRQANEPNQPSPVQTGGAPVNGTEVPVGSLDRQYIQDAVRAITPLIRECYELALAEDQTLGGRLVMEFDIEGEPDAGGVVESSEVSEDSTIHHPTLDECVAQTLYILELPAPEGGGKVHVRYPFVFSSDPGEGEAP